MAGSWQKRIVTDLMFEIEGNGWYPAELQEGFGFRWSGPGKVSTLSISTIPGYDGHIEISIFAIGVPPLHERLKVYLNGELLNGIFLQVGPTVSFRAPFSADQIGRQQVSQLWFMLDDVGIERDASGAIQRRLGVAVSSVTVEPGAERVGSAELANDVSVSDALGDEFFKNFLRIAYDGSSVAFRSSEVGVEEAFLFLSRCMFGRRRVGDVLVHLRRSSSLFTIELRGTENRGIVFLEKILARENSGHIAFEFDIEGAVSGKPISRGVQEMELSSRLLLVSIGLELPRAFSVAVSEPSGLVEAGLRSLADWQRCLLFAAGALKLEFFELLLSDENDFFSAVMHDMD